MGRVVCGSDWAGTEICGTPEPPGTQLRHAKLTIQGESQDRALKYPRAKSWPPVTGRRRLTPPECGWTQHSTVVCQHCSSLGHWSRPQPICPSAHLHMPECCDRISVLMSAPHTRSFAMQDTCIALVAWHTTVLGAAWHHCCAPGSA